MYLASITNCLLDYMNSQQYLKIRKYSHNSLPTNENYLQQKVFCFSVETKYFEMNFSAVQFNIVLFFINFSQYNHQ